jgi:hypothetical protein
MSMAGSNRPRRRGTAPAEGERRAMAGYVPQYRVAASLILTELRGGTLEAIRIADPEAGRVDDIQVLSNGRLDAYQVKWHQYPGAITFHNITTPEAESSPALILQLADGWKRLSSAHSARNVVVHLVTNAIASTHDTLPAGDPRPNPCHFASFMQQEFVPVTTGRRSSGWQNSPGWQPAWKDLLSASSLSQDDFSVFVGGHLTLELGFSPEPPLLAGSRETSRYDDDLQRLSHWLAQMAGDAGKTVHFSRSEILSALDWRNRYEFRFRHEFPVDLELHETIAASAEELGESISSLDSGYVAVIGTPGSGKSTLLTTDLRSGDAIVVRYYAYVPGAVDPVSTRGESENFLHDMVLSLNRLGFSTGANPTFDRQILLEQFHQYLGVLHQHWRETGRKVVLVIDGLDHIDREQSPSRSLLQDLPAPEQIPGGVLILLGTQTDECLPSRVQYAVRQPGRRIEMKRLPRESIWRLSSRYLGREGLPEDWLDRLFLATGGHPLALVYLLRKIRHVSVEEASTILSAETPFEGEIAAQYQSYWDSLQGDAELRDLLPLLARMRSGFDADSVLKWVGSSPLIRLQRGAGHYFIRRGTRWRFFHNSFRLFLIQATSTIGFGVDVEETDRTYHRQLAAMSGEASSDSEDQWNYVYHLSAAGEHRQVIDVVTRGRAEDQLNAFRPIPSIELDVKLALRSAGSLKDAVAIARLMILASELEQRRRHLEDVRVEALLIAIGESDRALGNLLEEGHIQLDRAAALEACQMLWDEGLHEDAAQVFEVGEPLDALWGNGVDPYAREDDSPLYQWASCASRFRELGAVLSTIAGLQLAQRPHGGPGDHRGLERLKARLRFGVGISLVRDSRWGELQDVALALQSSPGVLISLLVEAAKQSEDLSRAQGFVEQCLAGLDLEVLPEEPRVLLAEAVYRVLGDASQAGRLVEGIVPPGIPKSTTGMEGLEPFALSFRLNRLLAALGRTALDQVSSEAESAAGSQGRLARAVRQLAVAEGLSWAGSPVPLVLLEELLTGWIRIGYPRSTDQRVDQYLSLGTARAEFFELLVEVVGRSYPDATDAVRHVFETEWADPHVRIYWPPARRRALVLGLLGIGVDGEWAVSQLEQLQAAATIEVGVYDRIQELRDQAEAWTLLGQRDAASACLIQMVRIAAGLGYKDTQVGGWIRWLDRINTLDPSQASSRLQRFTGWVLTMKDTTEEVADTAAERLLSACFHWSPGAARALFRLLANEGLLSFQAGARIMATEAALSSPAAAECATQLFLEFVVPLSHGADRSLVQQLIDRARESGSELGASRVGYMLERSAIVTPGLLKAEWLDSIRRSAAAAGFEMGMLLTAEAEQDASPAANTAVRLRDGRELSEHEIRELALDPTALEGLLRNESDETHFDWTSLMRSLLATSSAERVNAYVALFEKRPIRSEVLSAASERLTELGARSQGWALGEAALAESDALGWDAWWGGNRRVLALEALIKADPVRGRDRALEVLVADLTSERAYPLMIAENLERILPLLTTEDITAAIWVEIWEHVQLLFGWMEDSMDISSVFEPTGINDTAAAAIVDLILDHVGYPAQAVAEAASRACLELLIGGQREMTARIESMLRADNAALNDVIPVVEAVSFRFPERLSELQGAILASASSRSFTVRCVALRISQRMGWPAIEEVRSIPLPASYRLSLPSQPTGLIYLDGSDAISGHRPLPNTTDPRGLLRLWEGELSEVAELAEVGVENLLRRIVELMHIEAPNDSWSAHGEGRLRAEMENMGLRGLPFTRPRHLVARGAIARAVAELFDCGRLNAEDRWRIQRMLRSYDPAMLTRAPSLRPKEVRPIHGDDDFGRPPVPWREFTDDWQESFVSTLDNGWLVLAEETNLRRSDVEGCHEIRRSAPCLPLDAAHPLEALIDVFDFAPFYGRVWNCQVEEYPSRVRIDPTTAIIVRHFGPGYRSPGEKWLALNPMLARALNWQSAGPRSLDWVSGQGDVAIRVIWWMDGWPDLHWYDRHEAGEGWLVLASYSALMQMRRLLGPLKVHRWMERTFGRGEDEERRAASDVTELGLHLA